jgi:Spy/CpxP family protein refolding chaperone
MKSLKVVITALALAAIASAPLSAQEKKGGGRGMNPEQQVARIDEAVTLTADQKTKVTAILTKAQEQIQALPQEERRTKGMEIREATNKEIRALLTPDQQKKFDAMPPPARGGGKKKEN